MLYYRFELEGYNFEGAEMFQNGIIFETFLRNNLKINLKNNNNLSNIKKKFGNKNEK